MWDKKLLIELAERDDFVVSQVSIPSVACSTCCKKVALYKCPACSAYSCSLQCVTTHKNKNDCRGIRQPVTKVSIVNFNDDVLRQDVKFLDRMGQITERSARYLARQFSDRLMMQSGHGYSKKHLPISIFRRKCEERGIRLKLCPPELSMRRYNTTQLTRKTKRLSWRIDWKFPACNKTFTDTAICEEIKLKDLLKRFIESDDKIHISRASCLGVDFENLNDCEVLFRDHSIAGDIVGWFALNIEFKIIDNLRNKHIYEFPTFVVVPKSYLNSSPYEHITRVIEEKAPVNVVQPVLTSKKQITDDTENLLDDPGLFNCLNDPIDPIN